MRLTISRATPSSSSSGVRCVSSTATMWLPLAAAKPSFALSVTSISSGRRARRSLPLASVTRALCLLPRSCSAQRGGVALGERLFDQRHGLAELRADGFEVRLDFVVHVLISLMRDLDRFHVQLVEQHLFVLAHDLVAACASLKMTTTLESGWRVFNFAPDRAARPRLATSRTSENSCASAKSISVSSTSG